MCGCSLGCGRGSCWGGGKKQLSGQELNQPRECGHGESAACGRAGASWLSTKESGVRKRSVWWGYQQLSLRPGKDLSFPCYPGSPLLLHPLLVSCSSSPAAWFEAKISSALLVWTWIISKLGEKQDFAVSFLQADGPPSCSVQHQGNAAETCQRSKLSIRGIKSKWRWHVCSSAAVSSVDRVTMAISPVWDYSTYLGTSGLLHKHRELSISWQYSRRQKWAEFWVEITARIFFG